ncbi:MULTISPECIES: SRPBCC family protein [unclassified Olleya]|uniref:SRPBCC family protein n=1 Tax=unclassified Olleya TaxID=2615019 RepID=UPI000C312A37|nr:MULTISPECIES: SRPBCC family protein [unclassified Olleya]AUC77651.1 orotate phosphoribosyltransferase [Olleya sp. Bg11-27]QXP60015.1 SRPBCC family protein [Olleya sp. HaHaR_3_96]
MKLQSPKAILDKSAETTFNFLSDVKNFESLMPENISKFEVLGEDKFLFALKGMPEIVLKKKELTPNNKIVLGAAGGKLDFSLTADITEIEASKTEVQLTFEGQFNAMMAMMIKGPINKFIETLATNMPKAISTIA